MTRSNRRRSAQAGAAMPIFLLALLPLIAAFYLVHGIGWKIHDRVQIQNIADRAAFAAAAETADGLNQIAFLNSALVTVKATDSVLRGIRDAYLPLLGYDCGLCFASWGTDRYHCKLCGKMLGGLGDVFPGTFDHLDRVEALHNDIAEMSDELIRSTALDAEKAGRDVARAAGVQDAVVIAYDQRGRLPYEDGDDYGNRPLYMAAVYYGLHVLPQDFVMFGAPEHLIGFGGLAAIYAKTGELDGFKVPIHEGDAQRNALAVTAFVSRDDHDGLLMYNMHAGGVAMGADPLSDQSRKDVAVARAEPYFTRNGGDDDGRPAWRARLRPLRLPTETGDEPKTLTADFGWAQAAGIAGGFMGGGGGGAYWPAVGVTVPETMLVQ